MPLYFGNTPISNVETNFNIKQVSQIGGDSVSPTREFMHISFDDVRYVISDLKSKNYASAFDHPFLGFLKQMHEAYGAVFSLYCMQLPSSIPNTYKDEFRKASGWLKWGLHAITPTNYASETYETGKSDWNAVVGGIVNFAGTPNAVDRIPRLHNFAGSVEALRGMRDANCGALGFLSAHDTRLSYYMGEETCAFLNNKNDYIFDFNEGFVFLRTDMSFDAVADTYSTLVSHYENSAYWKTIQSWILFGHENIYYTNGTLTDRISKIEGICQFASEYGVSFDFPQNRFISVPTHYDLRPSTSESEGEGNDDNGDTPSTGETYTITFVNEDRTVIQTSEVKAGTMPVYSGNTPTKESDAEYDYEFVGWNPTITTATADTTYTAIYDAIPVGDVGDDGGESEPDVELPTEITWYVDFTSGYTPTTNYTGNTGAVAFRVAETQDLCIGVPINALKLLVGGDGTMGYGIWDSNTDTFTSKGTLNLTGAVANADEVTPQVYKLNQTIVLNEGEVLAVMEYGNTTGKIWVSTGAHDVNSKVRTSIRNGSNSKDEAWGLFIGIGYVVD